MQERMQFFRKDANRTTFSASVSVAIAFSVGRMVRRERIGRVIDSPHASQTCDEDANDKTGMESRFCSWPLVFDDSSPTSGTQRCQTRTILPWYDASATSRPEPMQVIPHPTPTKQPGGAGRM